MKNHLKRWSDLHFIFYFTIKFYIGEATVSKTTFLVRSLFHITSVEEIVHQLNYIKEDLDHQIQDFVRALPLCELDGVELCNLEITRQVSVCLFILLTVLIFEKISDLQFKSGWWYKSLIF